MTIAGVACGAWGAASVSLAWDASPDVTVTGYRLHYGPSSGFYTNTIDVRRATTSSLGGLVEGATYFFVVTAYDGRGVESEPSNEVPYAVPRSQPPGTPQIASIADVTVTLGDSVPVVPLIVADSDTPAGSLLFSLGSDNQALLPDEGLQLLGSGFNRTVTLTPVVGATGQALVTVTVDDGALSAQRSFHFTVNAATNPPPEVLDVAISGTGTVSPNLDGRKLTVGAVYTLVAQPATGFLFAGWSGSVTQSSPYLRFTNQLNTRLRANFVPNMFLKRIGYYWGLFAEPTNVRHDTSGDFLLALSSAGAYSARVRIGGQYRVWTGRFALDRQSTNAIRALGTNTCTVNLALDTTNDVITGTIGNGAWVAQLEADKYSPYLGLGTNVSPFAGRYTVAVPAEAGTGGPDGDGWGRLYVSPRGILSAYVKLADAAAMLQVAPVSRTGRWPLYYPLYGGRGSILGWVQFADRPQDDLSGTVEWSRPALPPARFYAAGFTNKSVLFGSRYVYPGATNTPLPGVTDAELSLVKGNVTAPVTNQIALLRGGRVSNAGTNPLAMAINPIVGTFVGMTRDPANGRPLVLQGAVLQKANYGTGFFYGTNAMGRITIRPKI